MSEFWIIDIRANLRSQIIEQLDLLLDLLQLGFNHFRLSLKVDCQEWVGGSFLIVFGFYLSCFWF
jgi:hypothetical protein